MRRIKPMLLVDNGRSLDNPQFVMQEKYDGTRALLIKKNGKFHIMSRSWHEYTGLFPVILSEARKIKGQSFILDGELAFFKGGRDIFLTIAAKPETKKGFKTKLMLFDILELNNRDMKNLPLEKRYTSLKAIIPRLSHIQVVKNYPNKKSIYNRIVSDARQGEGVVLKRKGSKYYEDIRSHEWIKVKDMKTTDVVLVGVTHGTGVRTSTFGALLLGQYKNGTLVPVGASSGFSEAEQRDIIRQMSPLKTASPPSNEFSERFRGRVKYWVRPRICCEVKYQERTKYGILRFPAFVRIRHDKKPKECVV